MRVDEITLHPRDNAMVLATHGRALWILDHLEPIQEYAAAQAADAKLFTPPPSAMYRRPASDRNYEFWGDQTFFGENPPQAAVVSWFLKKQAGEVKLKITDATGHDVREISGPVLASANKAGIESACWDLRVQPVPAPLRQRRPVLDEEVVAQRARPVEALRRPSRRPTIRIRIKPESESVRRRLRRRRPRRRRRIWRRPNGGRPGPFVLAGTYNVALIVDGKTIDTKPLRVAADPEVVLTSVERKRLRHGDGDARAAATRHRNDDRVRHAQSRDDRARDDDRRPQRHSRRRESVVRRVPQRGDGARASSGRRRPAAGSAAAVAADAAA